MFDWTSSLKKSHILHVHLHKPRRRASDGDNAKTTMSGRRRVPGWVATSRRPGVAGRDPGYPAERVATLWRKTTKCYLGDRYPAGAPGWGRDPVGELGGQAPLEFEVIVYDKPQH